MTSRASSLGWLATGAVANAAVGAIAVRRGRCLPAGVRVTGNGTFVAFAAPFLRGGAAGRGAWWTYAGAHCAHLAHLVEIHRRHRGSGASFSSTSRYGGAAGYATIALLGATSYAPGAPPCRHATVRHLHRAGEQLLFGIYGFTIVHGFLAKGRNPMLYGPLAALWLIAAAMGRARWGQ